MIEVFANFRNLEVDGVGWKVDEGAGQNVLDDFPQAR